MKLVTLAFAIALAHLGSAIEFNQAELEALISIPCEPDRRAYFDKCAEGPDCVACVSKGTEQCIQETNKDFFDLGCVNCITRAKYIYCKVDPLNGDKKLDPNAPLPAVFKSSDAFKNKKDSPGQPAAAAAAAPADESAVPPSPTDTAASETMAS